MKAIDLIYKPFMLLLTAAIIFGLTNTALAQGKKKIIRVIEVDDKGEKVVKEVTIPEGDKHIKIISDGDLVGIDSIDKMVKIHLSKIDGQLDSIDHFVFRAIPGEFLLDHDFDFDFDFDFPSHLDIQPVRRIMLFGHDSIDKSTKMYFRDKNFDNKKDLDKILEEVENGTFDPKKWDMQEVDKDKMKDLKGKGNFLVLSDKGGKMEGHKGFAYVTAKCEGDGKEMQVIVDKGRRMIHLEGDTVLAKGKFKTYTVTAEGDSDKDIDQVVWVSSKDDDKGVARIKVKTIGAKDKAGHVYITSGESLDSTKDGKVMTWTVQADADGDDMEKVILISGDGKEKNQKIKIKKMDGAEGKKDVMVTVVADDKGKTEVQFTDPSADEMKMLVKNGFAKNDEKNKIESIGLMVSKKDGNEKYTIVIKSDESGKVKLILSDDKGKKLKTEEFEHKKGKTEHELGFKDFKSGVYFLQLQINSKSTTRKVEITKE